MKTRPLLAVILALLLLSCSSDVTETDAGAPDAGAGGKAALPCESASMCPPVECTIAFCEGAQCTYSPLPEGMCCGAWGFQCLSLHCVCDGAVKPDGTCASNNLAGQKCALH